MFQKLVNHNKDIRLLVDKGYAVAFDSAHLVIRDIPYLDDNLNLQIGAIVSKLIFRDEVYVTQDDHQIFFAGSVPHNLDGKPIPNLAGGLTKLVLSDSSQDVVVQRSFSNKPKDRSFNDLFEKIESYVGIISGPAMELHGATPYTFNVVEKIPNSIFKFHDTLTSLAEITDLSAKFKDEIVAVIGIGGTGAYLLDFLVKTPVREIRAFDMDSFHIHNMFRSPGRSDKNELQKSKAEVYQERYQNFREGVKIEKKIVDTSSVADFEGVTFAFVCVDKGTSRSKIFELLIAKNIPFIDTGMGLKRREDMLNGELRITYYPKDNGQKVFDKGLAPVFDNPDNLYRTNVQISELNALNAALAIIKYKQLRGFYFQEIDNYNYLFEIGDCKVVGESEF